MKIKVAILLICLLVSCTSKKEIHYLQNADEMMGDDITFQKIIIQPNDILRINVGALVPETAMPYNRTRINASQNVSLDLLKLDGYLVSEDKTIEFPELGTLSVDGKTTTQLEMQLKKLLTDGGHLVDPTVSVRIINAKFTVLGEVKKPGTYSFTEERITLLQALGFAGDLTINAIREDVLVMREENGVRKITHINLTMTDWVDEPNYLIKPNDVIIVNQNPPKVTSAGYINSLGVLLGAASFTLGLIILFTQ